MNNDNVILLNCARNCIRYIVRLYNIEKIYIPFYTCPVVWQALQKEKCKIKFYHINNKFMPETDFSEDDYILYTNYFGICSENINKLIKKYKNLIVDNSQAFFMKNIGLTSFNSLRKFFRVPDGAILYSNKHLDEKFETDNSFERYSHIIKRKKLGFNINEDSFNNEPIKYMSKLTRFLFSSIDIYSDRQKRLENFNYLHNVLYKTNELKIKMNKEDVPFVYPYLTRNENVRKALIKNKIHIEKYWNPIPEKYFEGILQKYLLPLPIEQKYDISYMQKILTIINS